ncbi:glutathione S-transferase 1 isoform X2 [Dendroctonus ponderosae]|uniref:glutathione S-transferase 1 isoform X2 n=1 Tax=Dendroctonus ponderosae TaxID=77166 RepID=UPI00203513E5|nr:glutathione S-transferase 1 isoform X2 [Dendroctonus ponderosae]
MGSKAIDIYYYSPSPPSRAVLMLMKALGLEHNIKITNVVIGESKKPEFIKMNPLHTIPLITDNDWHLYDSHVIMQYLVDKYAKDDSLYPKDLKKRAIVNLRLFFDACYLFPKFGAYHAPTLYSGIAPSEENAKAMDEVLMHLDHFLEENKYTAGSHLTIADFAIIPTIATIDVSLRICRSN